MNQHHVKEAVASAKIDQFDLTKFDPGQTKLGPCHWFDGRWASNSWSPSVPIFPKYIELFKELGAKYQHIDWLPLDIPRIELSDVQHFKDLWYTNSAEITKQDDIKNSVEWRGLHIHCMGTLDFAMHDAYDIRGKLKYKLSDLDETLTPQQRPILGPTSRKLFKHKFFNNIISQVMEYYPIYTLSNIMILEPIADVSLHREQSWPWKCPTEFRTMLHDENTVPTIHLTDIETEKTVYIDLPKDTNSMCWSNGTKMYGVDYHGAPAFQLVVNAIWDSQKVSQLLDRSIKKYGMQGL